MKNADRISIDLRPKPSPVRRVNWPWIAVYAILAVMIVSLLWLVQVSFN